MSSRRGLFPTGAEKSAESIQVAAHSGKITGLYQAICFLSSRPNASREIILRVGMYIIWWQALSRFVPTAMMERDCFSISFAADTNILGCVCLSHDWDRARVPFLRITIEIWDHILFRIGLYDINFTAAVGNPWTVYKKQ